MTHLNKVSWTLAAAAISLGAIGSSNTQSVAIGSDNANEALLRDGDIIFQRSFSSQSDAISLSTHSPYTHCGVVISDNGNWVVYHATQPVSKTPLKEWIASGDGGKYVIKRLKDKHLVQLTKDSLQKLRAYLNKQLGKKYDFLFAWSDDKIYCSELVWKAYWNACGIKLATPKKIGDFDLSSKLVQAKLKEKYGDNVPLNETVVAPSTVFESDRLVTVASR